MFLRDTTRDTSASLMIFAYSKSRGREQGDWSTRACCVPSVLCLWIENVRLGYSDYLPINRDFSLPSIRKLSARLPVSLPLPFVNCVYPKHWHNTLRIWSRTMRVSSKRKQACNGTHSEWKSYTRSTSV